MRLTVLGGCGAWPEAGSACSGFLLEQDGFALLVDLGYATLPRLLGLVPAEQIGAVFISHGHPDHCADLSPLLRARALRDDPPPALPVYAPPAALDPVLALDQPRMLAGAIDRRDFSPGQSLRIGPFDVATRLLPHWLPDAGARITAGPASLMYTGDSGPSPARAELADGVTLLLAEASYPDRVPEDSRPYLSSARQAGQEAARAKVGRLVLTHLMPGTDHAAALTTARAAYDGSARVAVPGLVLDLDPVW